MLRDTVDQALAADLAGGVAPGHGRRRLVSLDCAGHRVATADPLVALLDKRRESHGRVVGRHLSQTFGALPADDQQLIRLRHEVGLKVSQIAAMLGADQNRRYQVIHARLRTSLAAAGVSARDVAEVTSGEVSCVPRVLRTASC